MVIMLDNLLKRLKVPVEGNAEKGASAQTLIFKL
jgi:hypothetical protein